MKLYFIGLVPGENLREAVKQLKLEMRENYGAGHALKSPAHITLQMPFRKPAEEEQEVISSLARFAEQQTSFKVGLEDFDCFPPRVIFIRIVNHSPVVAFRNELVPVLRDEIGLSAKQIGSRFHPHLTVATRDLAEEQFPKAWEAFSKRQFRAEFEVRSLFLLRHNSKYWDIYREFEFGRQSS
jgi:2'-5' RNA ligase